MPSRGETFVVQEPSKIFSFASDVVPLILLQFRVTMEKPPVIMPRVRVKGLVLSLLAVFGVLIFLLYVVGPRWPKESELIQNFYAHRAAYEQLRDMFLADAHVRRVASYGVAITNTIIITRKPEEVNFPIDRYNEYLALLKEAGAIQATRGVWEQSSDPAFYVWGWGWAGNTRHICICWKAQDPTNQVANLYQRQMRGENDQGVYKHIEGHWYVWRD